MGEFSVWFAFGPMAVAIATVSQNAFPDWRVFLLMPVSGFSTLSILLVGQLIDLDADVKGGKHGVASRMGTRFTAGLYIAVQTLLIIDVVVMALTFPGLSWILLVSLVPYVIFFPGTAVSIARNHKDPESLKAVAKSTVQIHLLLSILLIVGFGLYLI
jgi:1,4-dihydroxy-2-naphthoate octaprenyltransferase